MEGVRTHLFDRAVENPLMRLPTLCNGTKHTFISLSSASHTEDITHTSSQSEKMDDAVVQHIAHRVARQDISAYVHHPDVSGQSGSDARMASST